MHLLANLKNAMGRSSGRVRRRGAAMFVLKATTLFTAFALGALSHRWSLETFVGTRTLAVKSV